MIRNARAALILASLFATAAAVAWYASGGMLPRL